MRWLHFEGRWDGEGSPQVFSAAAWFRQVQHRGFNPPYGGVKPGGGGSLKVITTHMTPGYVTSYPFKREPDGSKWHPEPCRITLPNR
jgi:hypothetical protein